MQKDGLKAVLRTLRCRALVGVAALGALLLGSPVASAQTAFGQCPATMLISQSASNQNSTLYSINTTNNPFTFTTIAQAGLNYNAIGFNLSDRFIYGIQGDSNHLVRVGANGVAADLGVVSGLPVGSYLAGEIDDAGILYVMVRNTSTLYKINVNATPYTATAVTLSQQIDSLDLGYINGRLYSVVPSDAANASGTKGQLFRINPNNGNVVFLGTADPTPKKYGAMFATPNGLYGNENNGGFYQIDLATGAATLLSNSPGAVLNDGAHCVNAGLALPTDIRTTKTDNTTTYVGGGTLTYTVTVTNGGNTLVQGINVADPQPTNVTFASWTCATTGSGSSCTASGSGAINDTINLAAGGVATYTITAQVAAAKTGNLVNTVTATAPSDYTDSNTGNDSASDTDTQAVANLAVTKTDSLTNVNRGAATTYTIVVTNNGPQAANGAVVTDTTSGANGGTLTCTTASCTGTTGGATCPAQANGTALRDALLGTGAAIPTLPNGGTVTLTVSCTAN